MDNHEYSGGCDGEDIELMRRVRRGDSAAFARLYEKYRAIVISRLMNLYGRSVSPEDIVQEAFARLWARRHEYRGQAKFTTYLYSYVHRVYLEERRSHARQSTLAGRLLQDCSATITGSESPEAAARRAEMNGLLQHALAQLTAQQREALVLYYTERMSLQEAARAAGCTRKCFESRVLRGCRKLRYLLSARMDAQAMTASMCPPTAGGATTAHQAHNCPNG